MKEKKKINCFLRIDENISILVPYKFKITYYLKGKEIYGKLSTNVDELSNNLEYIIEEIISKEDREWEIIKIDNYVIKRLENILNIPSLETDNVSLKNILQFIYRYYILKKYKNK